MILLDVANEGRIFLPNGRFVYLDCKPDKDNGYKLTDRDVSFHLGEDFVSLKSQIICNSNWGTSFAKLADDVTQDEKRFKPTAVVKMKGTWINADDVLAAFILD